MANDFHKQLRADVARSRPKLDAATAFDGRIFSAAQALGSGLVDRIGDLDEAILIAGQMGGERLPAGRKWCFTVARNDPANSIYAITANVPLQGAGLLPSLPGLDRAKMPTFLSVWQPELTMEKLGGK